MMTTVQIWLYLTARSTCLPRLGYGQFNFQYEGRVFGKKKATREA
jgi:hypothetical protein